MTYSEDEITSNRSPNSFDWEKQNQRSNHGCHINHIPHHHHQRSHIVMRLKDMAVSWRIYVNHGCTTILWSKIDYKFDTPERNTYLLTVSMSCSVVSGNWGKPYEESESEQHEKLEKMASHLQATRSQILSSWGCKQLWQNFSFGNSDELDQDIAWQIKIGAAEHWCRMVPPKWSLAPSRCFCKGWKIDGGVLANQPVISKSIKQM